MHCRVEELKHLVAKTETEEKHQAEKYVRALKEGEKALEEKTASLREHGMNYNFREVCSHVSLEY